MTSAMQKFNPLNSRNTIPTRQSSKSPNINQMMPAQTSSAYNHEIRKFRIRNRPDHLNRPYAARYLAIIDAVMPVV